MPPRPRAVNTLSAMFINPVDAPIGKLPISLIIGNNEPVLQMVCIPTERFEGLQGGIASMELAMDTVEVSKTGQTLFLDDLRVERIQ